MSSFLYKTYKTAPFQSGFVPDFDLYLSSTYKNIEKIFKSFVSLF